MNNKTKVLLSAILTIAMCLSVIAGSTLALFTSESSTSISVTAGKVNVAASLKDLQLYSVEPDDAIETSADNYAGTVATGLGASKYKYVSQPEHFANGGTAEIAGNALTLSRVTPGDKVTLNVGLNNTSNVDIKYRVIVNVTSGVKLYNALKVKVGGVTLNGVSKTGTWTYLAANTAIADVPVEVLLPVTAPNEYQELSTALNIKVEAVQGNAYTQDEVLTTEVEATGTIDEVTVDNSGEEPVYTNSSNKTISADDGMISVTLPADTVLTDSETNVKVSAKPQDTESNITVLSTQASASYDVSVLFVITETTGDETTTTTKDAVDVNNNEYITVALYVGTGLTGVKLYHKTDEITDFTYNSETGIITFQTKGFSEYTVLYNKDYVYETFDEEGNSTGVVVLTATETTGVYTSTNEQGEEEIVVVHEDEQGNVTTKNVVVSLIHGNETVSYETVAEAAQAAQTGDTIKLLKDVTVTNQNVAPFNVSFNSRTVDAMIGTMSAGVTFDGDGHTVTVAASGIHLFGEVDDLTIKNLTVHYDDVQDSSNVFYSRILTMENVVTTGELTFSSGNAAAFVIYPRYDVTMTDCVNRATIRSLNGDSTIYDAVFIGYTLSTGVITMTRCNNEGSLVCGKAGMFVANWSYSANSSFKINDCKNNGFIQSTSSAFYNGAGSYNYCTADYWDKAGCLNFQFNGGEIYTASTAVKWYNIDVQQSLIGTGSFVAGPTDETLALSLNADGTFTVTPASAQNVDHYVVSVGTYTATATGSGRTYVVETLTGLTSTIQNLPFVDAAWVEANEGAVEGTLAGYTIYTLNEQSYYLVGKPDVNNVGGQPHAPEMISVSALDAEDNLIASAGFVYPN